MAVRSTAALLIAGLCAAVVATLTNVSAAERGTPAEAKAMLQKAVAHYTSVGRGTRRTNARPR